MDRVVKLTDKERGEIFRETASKMNTTTAVVEIDSQFLMSAENRTHQIAADKGADYLTTENTKKVLKNRIVGETCVSTRPLQKSSSG